MIWGIKGEKVEIQALRYPISVWTATAASEHCKSRGGSFEAASGKAKAMIIKAYSVLHVKQVDEDLRILEGIATTPSPDRADDVIVPEGIQFSLPFPLLYQHNSRQPIGMVVDASVSKDGMAIKAKVAPAGTAQFIDEAWALIKARLVRGLSVGFRSLEESWDKQRNAFNYLRTELLEISAVTIPANAEATITTVKSADVDSPAALGHGLSHPARLDTRTQTPGASGQDNHRTEMKTIAEQIASFEAKRAAAVARMAEVMAKAGEDGRTLDPAETEEYDGLNAEVKTVDEHLVRLKAHEKLAVASATQITEKTAGSPEAASRARSGIVTVKGPVLPPGTAFTRYVIAMAASRFDRHGRTPLQIAQSRKDWRDTTPEVEMVLRDAINAGDTTTAGWAAELVNYQFLASEFIEYLRPQTILGKFGLGGIQDVRHVPFMVKIPLQDSGATANWVGQGLAKPVGKLHFDTTSLTFSKAAGIVVITDELARFSNPSAEALIRQDLANTIIQFLDEQFIDPTVVAVPNVSPASVTNGATNSAASGTDADDFRADLQVILQAFVAANISPSGAVFVLEPTLAVALMLMRNALGQKEFPDVRPDGGSLEGFGVITSNSCASGVMTFLKPSEILVADDGGIQIDVSREATITMDDGTSPASTTAVSMFQNNMLALRVERIINWIRRRDDAVYYLTGCAYGAGSP